MDTQRQQTPILRHGEQLKTRLKNRFGWLSLGFLALGLGVWVLRPQSPRSSPSSVTAPAIDSIRSSAAAPQVIPLSATQTSAVAPSQEQAPPEVEEQVNPAMAEAFDRAGWSRVEAPEPDPAILEWRPETLKDPVKSEELLTQLRTQDPQTPIELAHAEQIATDQALDPRFRRAAIEALTRSSTPEAQAALLRIVSQSRQAEKERSLALSGVRPSSAEDAAALYLKEWVESRQFPESLKDQAASTWVARALLDGQSRSQALSQWKSNERVRISRIWKALSGEG